MKTIIGRAPRFEIAGEAGTAKEGFRMAKTLNPDLVLVDISLPDQSGIDLTRRIRGMLPETRVLIISMHSKVSFIAEAFQAGATGYMVKESAAERLLQGLDTVLAGDYYLDSAVSHQVVERILALPKENAKISDGAYGALTPREQEVMRLLARASRQKRPPTGFSSAPRPWKTTAPTLWENSVSTAASNWPAMPPDWAS